VIVRCFISSFRTKSLVYLLDQHQNVNFESLSLYIIFIIALALLRPYSGSHAWMAMTEIPLHWWKPWKFSTAPRGWFSGLVFRMEQDIVRQTAIREYFSELEEQYGIRSIEDWVKFPARKLPLVLYHRFGNIKRTILPWIYGVDVIRNTKKVPFAQQKQMRQHADSVFKVDIDGVA